MTRNTFTKALRLPFESAVNHLIKLMEPTMPRDELRELVCQMSDIYDKQIPSILEKCLQVKSGSGKVEL